MHCKLHLFMQLVWYLHSYMVIHCYYLASWHQNIWL